MNRLLHIPIFLAIFTVPHFLSAQIGICNQVVASAGKSTMQGGRWYTYTVGEPVILTLSGNGSKITQGFNQPDLCLPVFTNDLNLADWELEIYPNPTANLIHFRYTAEKDGRLRARVFDLLGRTVVEDFSIDQPNDTPMDCSTWQPGVYLVQMQDPQTKAVATARIIRL